jgi:hypothetical protein
MTNVGVGGENCFQKPHNVSLNPSPIIAARCNASKNSCFTFISCPKLSLFSQNKGGGK